MFTANKLVDIYIYRKKKDPADAYVQFKMMNQETKFSSGMREV